MNQPIILDMQALVQKALQAGPAPQSFFETLLVQAFGSSNPVEKDADGLLGRADDYETTQSSFADELRFAAARSQEDVQFA